MIKRIAKNIKKLGSTYWKHYLQNAVQHVLDVDRNSDCRTAEDDFHKLQSNCDPRPEYGYDMPSILNRAHTRTKEVLRLLNGAKQQNGLEVGSGDGMLGALLQSAGHYMTLSDVEDWRVREAMHLPMFLADCSLELPFCSEEFDFVISYNTFEHLPDPGRAFAEIWRITKRGGLVYLNFDPLYCSPWGLHVYRTLRMPYPQFLFSQEFVQEKLDELGIWDLGRKRQSPQYVNEWRLAQYEALWKRSDCVVIESKTTEHYSWLNLVLKYPRSFHGRGLLPQDLIQSQVAVAIRKV